MERASRTWRVYAMVSSREMCQRFIAIRCSLSPIRNWYYKRFKVPLTTTELVKIFCFPVIASLDLLLGAGKMTTTIQHKGLT
jgi:hypothetical protein